MSKKSKSLSKQKNLREKQNKKTANKALYASYIRSGENSKRSRTARNSRKKGRGRDKGKHLIAHCGNPACKKCFKVTETGVYAITYNPKQKAA